MKLEEIMMMLCGLGLFLYGMKLMGDGLELAAGNRLKNMIGRLTRNKYMGALVGIVVTAVVQSSSATTVMVVGFVNAGLMSLTQAVGIIMGANVGTTITGLMIAIKLNAIAPMAIFIGVMVMMFAKKNNHKHIGQIVTGFGILFFGMTVMSDSMSPLAKSPMFAELVANFKNPLIGVLIGLGFTAIIQSSAASMGVLMALATQGIIGLDSAVFVIFGQNIGTCVTALLSCIGTTKTAKRTAIVHLLFNIFGAGLFITLSIFTPFITFVQDLIPGNVLIQISVVHILFNVVTTLLLLPLSNWLIKLACHIIPGEDKQREAMSLRYLDSRILKTPPIAVAQVTKEVERMGKIAKANYLLSMNALFNCDSSQLEELEENEGVLNFLNTNITEYLVKINSLELEDSDRKLVGALFHVVSDFERIGDHSENIGEQAEIVINKKVSFSTSASAELHQMQAKVTSIIDDSVRLFAERGRNEELAKRVSDTENEIDNMTDLFKENHISRLNKNQCTPVSGAVYNDLIMNLERIADHSTNIAFSLGKGTGSSYTLPHSTPVAQGNPMSM